MELDALETKAVELLRSKLEKGSITALNARVEPQSKDLVSVNGTFEDPEGHLSKFEVKFRVKQEHAQVISWYVSG
jgi:hypothetical protein